jgi:hypothetical protein
MNKEYIVGIHIGNEYTSAWYTAIDDNASHIQPSCSVRLINTNAPSERIIRTAIKLTENGDFSILGLGHVITDFNVKITFLNQQKRDAFKAFIKEIYQCIIKNNPHLVDNGNGDNNFYICISYPSKWEDEDKLEYVKFFNNALSEYQQEVRFCINENNAIECYAWQELHNCKYALVINYGHEIIDYTLIHFGLMKSVINVSNCYLGTRNIERAMLESYISDPMSNYQQARLATEQALNQTGNSSIDVRATLEYELRKEKERALTIYNSGNSNRPYDFIFRFDFYEETGEDIFYDDDQYNFRFRGFFRGDKGVCEKYITAVTNDFIQFREKTKLYGVSEIDSIIITGEGSMLPWIKEEIIKAFGNYTHIYLDREPEYSIAKGIVLCSKILLQS